MNTLEPGLSSVLPEGGAAYHTLRAAFIEFSRQARVSGVRIWDSVRFAKTPIAGFRRPFEIAFFNTKVGNLKDRNGIDPEPPAPVCDIIYTEQRDGEARRPGV